MRVRRSWKTSRFSCWDQYLCMAFAQLTYRDSLRDIEACLRAVQPKLYHLGIRARVARSTIAKILKAQGIPPRNRTGNP